MTSFPQTEIPPGSIIAVTGPSGSGKSKMLPLIIDCLKRPATLAAPTADAQKPLIDCWDNPPAANTKLLGIVGLADAFTWARTPAELSDGQRARFEIASALNHHGQVVILDDFTNGLDRVTAKAVAWTLQRSARKTGKTVIALTPHEDITLFLQPDLHVRTNWNRTPTLDWRDRWIVECPLIGELTYERGTIRDWHALSSLHYAAGDPATVHSYHVLRHPDLPHPAAVAVLSYPDLHSAARNLATDNAYHIAGNRQQAMKLNREVVKLSRMIACPELRCIGLSQTLIGSLIPNISAKYLECSTAMGRYSDFLLRLGFREIPQTSHRSEAALAEFIEAEKIDPAVLMSPSEWADLPSKLSVRKARLLRQIVWSYYHHFVLHRRTRTPVRKTVPPPLDPRWPDAFDVAGKRALERPAFFILGPLHQQPGAHGFPSVADQQLPPSDRIGYEPPSNQRSTGVDPAQPQHSTGTPQPAG